ncbi:hypothetical protein, partial [Bradyrhizobium sp. 5.13L]
RRWLQLPPPHPMAQPFAVPNPGRALHRADRQSSLKLGFFTLDCLPLFPLVRPIEKLPNVSA